MAAKANPIPQLPAPRKAVTAVSTETEQEAGLSVCLFLCLCMHTLQSVCPGLQQFPSAPCSPGTPSYSEAEA